jgi:multidrug efflux pump subunit AcrA (membrane-fusion protein)
LGDEVHDARHLHGVLSVKHSEYLKGIKMNYCSTRKVTIDVIRSIAVIGAAVGLLAGCIRTPKIAADQPVPIQLRAPHRLNEPSSVSASGSVEANVTAQTAFQVGGRVARVSAEEGQFVRQGQILAELDCSDYRNGYEAAAGEATAAEATALQAKNGVRAQELEQARVDFERAKDQYDRNKYLYDHQSLPAIDFHQIEAAYLVSQQRYEMAREGARNEEKQATQAQAHAANGQLSEAKKHLADCQLRAPITGFVGTRHVNVGDTVSAGYAVFSVLDLDPVKVRVGIPEAEIGKVHDGKRAVVTIPSLDNRQFEGKVEAVGYFADSVSRTFTTKIAVPNPAHVLRAGMISEARVYDTKMIDALTVPAIAVVRDLRGLPFVYVYDSTRERVFARQVEVGQLIGNEVEINSGLKPEDQIVVAGQQNVHEGSLVHVAGGGQ